MSKIIGNLTERSVKKYESLIKGGNLSYDDSGRRFRVSFIGDHALKHIRVDDLNNPDSPNDLKIDLLENAFDIGWGLELIGANVPKINGISLKNIPFIDMEKLNITPYALLHSELQSEAQKQWLEQYDLVTSHGYNVSDIGMNSNCGFDIKQNKLYLFDFDNWYRSK